MSKGKVNPSASIESVEESGGELTATITPQMAIQCARASLLLSSLRPPTFRQTDLDAQDMINLRRQVVDLSAEICWQRQQTKRSSPLENLEAILGFGTLQQPEELICKHVVVDKCYLLACRLLNL